MRRIPIYLGLLLIWLQSGCERIFPRPQQAAYFVKIYGGRLPDQGQDLLKMPNREGFVILGTTQSLAQDNTDILLLQTDLAGNEVRNQTFITDRGTGRSLASWPDSSRFFMAGNITRIDANGTVNQDALVSQYDWNLDLRGELELGFPEGLETVQDLITTSDGNLLLVGGTTQVDPQKNGANGSILETDQTDIWLVKINPQNNTVVWEKRYGFTGQDIGIKAIDHNGVYHILAQTDAGSDDPSETDILLIRLNQDGNILDQYIQDIGDSDIPSDFQIQQDDSWLVLSTAVNGNNGQVNLLEIDNGFSNASVSQLSGFTGIWNETRRLYQIPNDQSIVISSIKRDQAGAPGDIQVHRFLKGANPGDWELQWSNLFGYIGPDETGGLDWIGDESFLLSGTIDFGNSNTMACLIKTGLDGEGEIAP